MKKILMALAIAGIACSAEAQTTDKESVVCRKSSGKAVSCYVRQYTGEDQQDADLTPYTPDNVSVANVPPSMIAPQSQSYSGNYDVLNSNSYEGYYPQNSKRKPCKNTNNVADANQAPYNGCPSPQSDGPDKNRQRNLNVSNPEPQPSITGGK